MFHSTSGSAASQRGERRTEGGRGGGTVTTRDTTRCFIFANFISAVLMGQFIKVLEVIPREDIHKHIANNGPVITKKYK